MKGFGIGPAGGRALSRMQGTKVTLAGRTAFLPNDDVPFVMQKLTMGQINAIPKDRFSVALIEVPTRMGMALGACSTSSVIDSSRCQTMTSATIG